MVKVPPHSNKALRFLWPGIGLERKSAVTNLLHDTGRRSGRNFRSSRPTSERHFTEWCAARLRKNSKHEILVLYRNPVEWTGLESLFTGVEATKEHASRMVALRLETIRQTLVIPNRVRLGWLQRSRQLRNQIGGSARAIHSAIDTRDIARSCIARNRVGNRDREALYRSVVRESFVTFCVLQPRQPERYLRKVSSVRRSHEAIAQ